MSSIIYVKSVGEIKNTRKELVERFEMQELSEFECIEFLITNSIDLVIVEISGNEIIINLLIKYIKLFYSSKILVIGKYEEKIQLSLYQIGVDYIFDVDISNELLDVKVQNIMTELSEMKMYILDDVVNGVKVDKRTQLVLKNDIVIQLAKVEFDLLKALMEKTNKVISRDELETSIWGNVLEYEECRLIDVYIHKLRKKLGIDCIISVRGVGYMWKSR